MILERLVPGASLWAIEDRNERIKIFAEVATGLLLKDPGNLSLPNYGEVLDRAFSKAGGTCPRLDSYIKKAKTIQQRVDAADLPKYLLHGDLHHDNILSCKEGRKVIDPHGFIGNRVVESARFIENEIGAALVDGNNLRGIIELVGQYFKEERQAVAQALYVDKVLTSCWDSEEGVKEEELSEDIKVLELIGDYLEIK